MGLMRVRVDNLSKLFPIGDATTGVGGSVWQNLKYYGPLIAGGAPKLEENTFWALKNISFEVNSGEVIGIIGRNGSGKSTLLKILSRVIEPSSGKFEVSGRVGSLLEVGTGFHPDLTGRQNIYLNGSILGMKISEIDSYFDEIVAFAEVDQFIDSPVRYYSSGMYMRLAFSVAAHLERDVLFIDEVLAVGDIKFQRKCLALMRDSIRNGKTVFLVSHSSTIVLQVCTRVFWLDRGNLLADDAPQTAVERYVHNDLALVGTKTWSDKMMPEFADGSLRLRAIRLLDSDGINRSTFEIKEAFVVEVEFDVVERVHKLEFRLSLAHEEFGTIFVSIDHLTSPWRQAAPSAGRYIARCRFPAELLNEGTFSLDLEVETNPSSGNRVHVAEALIFRIFDNMNLVGVRGNWDREWPRAAIRPRLHWDHAHGGLGER